MTMASSTLLRTAALGLLAASGLVLAQDPPPQEPAPQDPPQEAARGGWRRVTDPPPPEAAPPPPGPGYRSGPKDAYGQDRPPDARGGDRNNERYNDRNGDRYGDRNNERNYQPPPPQLTIRPGTFITVRVNQPLSSDHSQPGDTFTATLTRPVVVDGVVVAERGETIAGRVGEARKAGRVEGVSRLAVQLTELTLVDGQQAPIQTQLIGRTGGTSVGRDVGAVAATTGLGAAVGAAADWGRGAAIGAGAGAAVGLIGVLLTRGHETVIYPETELSFRLDAPVTISTERAQQAFRYVDQSDYERPYDLERRPQQRPGPPPYYYGPRYYPYPYFYGSSFAFFYGPRFYGPRYYYRGGYRGYRR